MNIFEDGYLKNEFINRNYRGLVGWDCEVYEYGVFRGYSQWYKDTIVCISNNIVISSKNNECADVEDECLRIPQFKPEDIPVGEVCWVRSSPDILPFYSEWKLVVVEGVEEAFADNGEFSHYIILSDGCGYDEFSPFLIAETEKDAERLKDWHK